MSKGKRSQLSSWTSHEAPTSPSPTHCSVFALWPVKCGRCLHSVCPAYNCEVWPVSPPPCVLPITDLKFRLLAQILGWLTILPVTFLQMIDLLFFFSFLRSNLRSYTQPWYVMIFSKRPWVNAFQGSNLKLYFSIATFSHRLSRSLVYHKT